MDLIKDHISLHCYPYSCKWNAVTARNKHKFTCFFLWNVSKCFIQIKTFLRCCSCTCLLVCFLGPASSSPVTMTWWLWFHLELPFFLSTSFLKISFSTNTFNFSYHSTYMLLLRELLYFQNFEKSVLIRKACTSDHCGSSMQLFLLFWHMLKCVQLGWMNEKSQSAMNNKVTI